MDEIEKVQEQMKADPEALKEKMATMVEAMMSIKEIVEVSAAYQTRARAKIWIPISPSPWWKGWQIKICEAFDVVSV